MIVIRGELSEILWSQTLADVEHRMPHVATEQIEGIGRVPTLNEGKARSTI